SGLRREDAFGKVLRRIALRGAESRALGSAQPVPALLAEFGAWLIRGRATRAGCVEPHPALLAEDGIAGVVVPTPVARHDCDNSTGLALRGPAPSGQNLARGRLSCWHRRHCIDRTSSNRRPVSVTAASRARPSVPGGGPRVKDRAGDGSVDRLIHT